VVVVCVVVVVAVSSSSSSSLVVVVVVKEEEETPITALPLCRDMCERNDDAKRNAPFYLRRGFFRRKNLLVFAEKFKLGDASFKQLPRASPNLNFSANI
jgi:hypothetical protein